MSRMEMMYVRQFRQLVVHPVFLAAITSLILAQVLKAIIILITRPRRSFKEVMYALLWKTGGMPSSHSALVSALATSVGFTEGFDSSIFIVSLCLALIVIRDAMGVRRSAGLQARSLNMLGKHINDRFGIEYYPVKEIQGHAPLEVLVGALLGLLIASAIVLL
ncbi:divergent PAP2 family protein [Treponema sp. J25]|uniref:divergent PAP2 family protein n=1 Tax=Treponema sp. J25 TaxID=2094121 RepID=UPI00105332FD|nr:divergent PAP2 family protein [Treponema sp. J25]TCW60853.1 acid phosphatase [Treponema sp. J25]